jgi:hypothetical protein
MRRSRSVGSCSRCRVRPEEFGRLKATQTQVVARQPPLLFRCRSRSPAGLRRCGVRRHRRWSGQPRLDASGGGRRSGTAAVASHRSTLRRYDAGLPALSKRVRALLPPLQFRCTNRESGRWVGSPADDKPGRFRLCADRPDRVSATGVRSWPKVETPSFDLPGEPCRAEQLEESHAVRSGCHLTFGR